MSSSVAVLLHNSFTLQDAFICKKCIIGSSGVNCEGIVWILTWSISYNSNSNVENGSCGIILNFWLNAHVECVNQKNGFIWNQ